MKYPDPEWYKKIWTLDILDQSWVEDTENQVEFIIKALKLKGNERILDLACGFGRHALSFGKRGFPVVGVDITPEYIAFARKEADTKLPNVSFICLDIRDVQFNNEFDVVLNLADGAIGYLENEIENLKIFDRITSALKVGGKHFMDICNADHAVKYFPKRHWEIGSTCLSLADFQWDKENRRMLYGGYEMKFGEIAVKPELMDAPTSTRLYSFSEINEILGERGMKIVSTFSDYYGKKSSDKELQLMVYSIKEK